MKTTIVFLLLLACLGCATPNPPMAVVLTNPKTGESVYVAHTEYNGGILGGQAAMREDYRQRVAQEDAIKGYQAMGYTEMKVIRGGF